MLVKAAGCILILAGSTAFGYLKGREYKEHIDEIACLNQLIWQIAGEIKYTKAPFHEILARVKRRAREPYASWFESLVREIEAGSEESFGSLWRRTLQGAFKGLRLSSEEKEELAELGDRMGYLDIAMQEQVFSWYGEQLRKKQSALEQNLNQQRRICNCLGLAFGIFLLILLL